MERTCGDISQKQRCKSKQIIIYTSLSDVTCFGMVLLCFESQNNSTQHKREYKRGARERRCSERTQETDWLKLGLDAEPNILGTGRRIIISSDIGYIDTDSLDISVVTAPSVEVIF